MPVTGPVALDRPVEVSRPSLRAWPQQETIVLLFALALGFAHIVLVARDIPFWIDETYSGVIASQTSVSGLIKWCRNEMSGPVYYLLLWIWEKVAGPENAALRLPSAVFTPLAPLSILAFARTDRRLTFVWAALVAVCLPGLMCALQARPYGLLYLLASLQAVAFLAVMQVATRRSALGWSVVSAMLLLTHLHSAVITGVQGIMLIVMHRKRLTDLWPAMLPFIPVLAWMPLQLPFLLKLTGTGADRYQPLGPNPVMMFAEVLLGPTYPAVIVTILTFAILGWAVVDHLRNGRTGRGRPEVLLATSGLIAMALVLAEAYRVPAFTQRFMIPYLPAALLGVALAVERLSRHVRVAPTIVIGLLALATFDHLKAYSKPHAGDADFALEAESGSAWLAARGARTVIFAWDNPVMPLNDPRRMDEIGSFFFSRAGHAATVQSVVVPPGAAAAEPLMALARKRSAAILWIGGKEYPRDLATRLNTTCETRGGDGGHWVACVAPKS